jgi:hypothetical protein
VKRAEPIVRQWNFHALEVPIAKPSRNGFGQRLSII